MALILNQSTADFVVDETINVVALDSFTQESPVMPALFDQAPSSDPDEENASISALGDFQPRVELQEPSEDIPLQQFKKKYIHEEFDLQVKIERKIIDDQRFRFFGQLGQKLGQSAVRTYEKQAALQFNEAFSSAKFLAEDNLSLCNTAHVNKAGTNSQSNSGTTALSHASAGTTRNAMKDFTDYRGNEIVVEPDLLVLPNALEQTGWEIVRSSGDPDSPNLKGNFHNGRYGLVVWDYLTDANNWFLIDSGMMRMNLMWFWRMPLEIFGDGSLMKGMRQVAGYYRSSHGVNDWRWIFGQNVA